MQNPGLSGFCIYLPGGGCALPGLPTVFVLPTVFGLPSAFGLLTTFGL